MNAPDIEQYTDLLKSVGAAVSASESHGILCGLLCAGLSVHTYQQWVVRLLNEGHCSSKSGVEEFEGANQQLYQETVQQINHETLAFNLFLPDAHVNLALRTEALALWCQGFNFGMGLGGYKQNDEVSEDVAELVRDFSEISKAAYSIESDDDQEETAFIEIEEYVRVGVLLIMEELHPIKQKSPIIH